MKSMRLRQSKRNKALEQLMELSIQHSDEDKVINQLKSTNKEKLLLNKMEIEVHRKKQMVLRELISSAAREASYFKVSNLNLKDGQLAQSSCYIVDIDIQEDEFADLELFCYLDIIESGTRNFRFFRVSFVRVNGEFDYNGTFVSNRGYYQRIEEFDHYSSTMQEEYVSNIIEIVNTDIFRKLYENEKRIFELTTLN